MDQRCGARAGNAGRGFAIILGTNEIASAVAVRLSWEGFDVALSYDPHPPVFRRGMSFHDALFEDSAQLDGIMGRRAENAVEFFEVFARGGCVAVTPLHATDLIPLRRAEAIIDARMQKDRVTPDLRGSRWDGRGARTQFHGRRQLRRRDRNPFRACRGGVEDGPDLGLRWNPTRTRRPRRGAISSAPRAGVWRTPLNIGDRVYKGVTVGRQGARPRRVDGRISARAGA